MAATDSQIRELAADVAAQAQAIADGTLVGPVYPAVRRLQNNVETLEVWTADDKTRVLVPPLENLGTPLSELPAPVREKIAKLLADCAPVRWVDPSPSPNGAGRWKRPLTWVRIGHGEDKLTGYWLRDDTGAVIVSRIIQ